MSATQFAPEAIEILDLGTAIDVFVDGLACYSEEGGMIRTAFYANQPVISGDGTARFNHVIVLRLLYTPLVQETMWRQIAALGIPKDAAFKAWANRQPN